MNKNLKQRLLVVALVLVMPVAALLPMDSASAATTYSPGCYEKNKVVNCSISPGSNDFNGDPLDASTYCYILGTGPVQSDDSQWQPVLCSNLATPVTITATSTTTPTTGCATGAGSTSFCLSTPSATQGYGCGSDDQTGGSDGLVRTTIDFGCKGNACAQGSTTGYCSTYHNGIVDLLFALIRVLSDGVGIVVIGSIVVGGIQFSASRGDPSASAAAITRVRTSLIALLLFIFAYAILNYIIPNGFLN
jgi:hypothetical protein